MLGVAAEVKITDYVADGYCTKTYEVISQKVAYNLIGNTAQDRLLFLCTLLFWCSTFLFCRFFSFIFQFYIQLPRWFL